MSILRRKIQKAQAPKNKGRLLTGWVRDTPPEPDKPDAEDMPRGTPKHKTSQEKKAKTPPPAKPPKKDKKPRPGRRHAVKDASRVRRPLGVSLSAAEKKAVEEEAKRLDLPVSSFVRLVLFDLYGLERPHPERAQTAAEKKREDRAKNAHKLATERLKKHTQKQQQPAKKENG